MLNFNDWKLCFAAPVIDSQLVLQFLVVNRDDFNLLINLVAFSGNLNRVMSFGWEMGFGVRSAPSKQWEVLYSH